MAVLWLLFNGNILISVYCTVVKVVGLCLDHCFSVLYIKYGSITGSREWLDFVLFLIYLVINQSDKMKESRKLTVQGEKEQ